MGNFVKKTPQKCVKKAKKKKKKFKQKLNCNSKCRKVLCGVEGNNPAAACIAANYCAPLDEVRTNCVRCIGDLGCFFGGAGTGDGNGNGDRPPGGGSRGCGDCRAVKTTCTNLCPEAPTSEECVRQIYAV